MEISLRVEGVSFLHSGKEVLIKSIGQAIPTYAMSVFRVPKSLCDDITKSFARFWWGSNESKKKLHWSRWEKLCFPKSLGGLNFRDIEGFNKALLAKQAWRLIKNPDSLASRFLKDIYFKDTDFLNAELGRKPSFVWKSILWGRDLLNNGLRFRVGNENEINFFKDPWIPKISTFKPLCKNSTHINAKVFDFIDVSGNWRLNRLEDCLS